MCACGKPKEVITSAQLQAEQDQRLAAMADEMRNAALTAAAAMANANGN